MNRQEFFRRLAYLLKDIPESERRDALEYYNDYFDEAGAENEQKVMEELGSPEQVAQTILDDYRREHQGGAFEEAQWNGSGSAGNYGVQVKTSMWDKIKQMDTWKKVLLAFGIVILSPLLILGLVYIVVQVGVVILSIPLNAWGDLCSGISCVGTGIINLLNETLVGMTMVAVGFLYLSSSMLKFLLFVYIIGKWVPMFIRFCVKKIKAFWGKAGGARYENL